MAGGPSTPAPAAAGAECGGMASLPAGRWSADELAEATGVDEAADVVRDRCESVCASAASGTAEQFRTVIRSVNVLGFFHVTRRVMCRSSPKAMVAISSM
jgi:hypothetical protein